MLKIGLLINPVAGMGGALGLKGSDGTALQDEARERGGKGRGPERLQAMFRAAPELASAASWLTIGGAMGADLLAELSVPHRVVYQPGQPSSAADTQAGAAELIDQAADLVLFCGGDGTARDVLDALGPGALVLGVPSGVKMHSGVFATSPRAAAEVLRALVSGGLVSSRAAEVRDIDEQAVRDGRAASRYYGELRVPEVGGYIQATKVGGREDDDLALLEIVQGCVDRFGDSEETLVLGPGGTLAAVKQALGGTATLLGVDVRLADGRWLLDVSAAELESLSPPVRLLLSFGRGQGVLIGRGNQQLSPGFLRDLQPGEQIHVLASRSKLADLDGQPLLLDTGDESLDERWAGLWEVIAGFEDHLLVRVERA